MEDALRIGSARLFEAASLFLNPFEECPFIGECLSIKEYPFNRRYTVDELRGGHFEENNIFSNFDSDLAF